MKNHDLVPTALIFRIAGLKKGGAGLGFKAIKNLHRNKLVYHEKKHCKHTQTQNNVILHIASFFKICCMCNRLCLLFVVFFHELPS